MSRLDFAPKVEEIKITDIQHGLGGFPPKPDKAVSFATLKEVLKKAGYTLDSAEITVAGTLTHEDARLWVVARSSQQRFALEGDNLAQVLAGSVSGSRIEVTGDWTTTGENATAR